MGPDHEISGSEITRLTIWAGDFEESVRLREVDKVKLFEVISCARMRKAGHIVISRLVGIVDGASEDPGCP
jgi:hypothetical protein